MKKWILFLVFFLPGIVAHSQDIMCILSGAGTNTKTISATTACGHHFGASIAGLASNNDNYDCTSGNKWIGGEYIFYFKDVVKGTYIFTISGFATDLDLFVLSSCDENSCLTNQGAWGSSGRSESVTIDLEDGENVYLVIDGKFVNSAAFVLSVDCEGSVCDDLKYIQCGKVFQDSNTSYDRDATDIINSHGSCGAGSYNKHEIVYKLNTYNSPITIDLHPFNKNDIDLFVYDDCQGGLKNCLGASTISPTNESVYLASGVNGGDAFIAVDGKSHVVSYPTSGPYEIAVTCGEPCDSKPTKIGCNSVTRASTKGKANNASYYGCDGHHNKGHNWGPEAVYEFSIDDTYDIEIDLAIEGNVDLNLYLLKSNCDPTSCIASSKSDHRGKAERIKKRLQKGKYYVVVEGYQGQSGDFTLSLFGCGCEVEKELKCGLPINGTLVGKSNNISSMRGECFTKTVLLPNEDQTYFFIAPETGHYSFNLHSFNYGMDLFVTKDCEDPDACIKMGTKPGRTPEFVNVMLEKNEEVLVVVDGLTDYSNSKFVLEAICVEDEMDEEEMDEEEDEDEKEDEDMNEEPIPDDNNDSEVIMSCGEALSGSTVGNPSNFGRDDYSCFVSSLDFRGGESTVAFNKFSDDEILSVHVFHGDKSLENLSLFIMDSTFTEVANCKGNNFRADKTIGNGSSVGEYYTDFDNPLPAGKYYAVLDGYNSRVASEFTISTSCSKLDCESIIGLPCGESLLPESTVNSSNGESIYYSDSDLYIGYTGTENIYSFCLDSMSAVDITLYGIHEVAGFSSDVDMFLMANVCSDEKEVLASSRNSGLEDENIKAELEAGEYYIVVDGWDGARANFSIRNETCYSSLCGKSKKEFMKDAGQLGNMVSVYPNPFAEQLTIQLENTLKAETQVSVFDQSGKLIGELILKGGEGKNHDLTELFVGKESGVYTIFITDGEKFNVENVIKM